MVWLQQENFAFKSGVVDCVNVNPSTAHATNKIDTVLKMQKENITVVLLNRITALDQAIKDKTTTLEAMKSEENVLISTKDGCE